MPTILGIDTLRYPIANRQTGPSCRHPKAFRDGPLHGPPIDADKAIPWVQEKLAVQLSESQH